MRRFMTIDYTQSLVEISVSLAELAIKVQQQL